MTEGTTPPQPAPTKPWHRRWWVGPLIFVVILAGGLVVWKVYSDSQDQADIPAIEQAIEDDQADQGYDVTVDCPDSIDWEVGEDFHCIVEDGEGGHYTATVSMENDAGDVTWRIE